jgi:hypothetical protein
MKIIITESQSKLLFSSIPVYLKRRLTTEDLEWIERKINSNINDMEMLQRNKTYNDNFESYSYSIIADTLHEFVLERKDDEIETEMDPQYGLVYNDESRDRVFDMYWQLIPYFEKIYHSAILDGFNNF